MASFNQRLKELRLRHEMSQQALADRIGLSKSSINMYERGEREPGLETLEAIADFFNVDMNYLLGKSNISNSSAKIASSWSNSLDKTIDYSAIPEIRPIKMKRFPMLGTIACGKPVYTEEEHECYVDAGADINADFCLTAKGDSMINARVHEGDVVFIKAQNMVENGEIAAVLIDNETTLKRVYYYPDQNKLILTAENAKYPPLVYSGEELNYIKILGKAICFMSNF